MNGDVSFQGGMEVGELRVEGWVADRISGTGTTISVRAILFSDHSAAYLDPEDDEWFIVDRDTGHQINLSPFYSQDLNHLALTCYFLEYVGTGERDATDLIKAESLATDSLRSCTDDHRVNSFVADFSEAALELIGP